MAKLKINYPLFRHAPAVTLGRGSMRSLAGLNINDTAFLLSGNESVNSYVSEALARGGQSLSLGNSLKKPAGEPTADTVREAAKFLTQCAPRRVVAIGGGSVMDWARLAWAECHGLIDLASGDLDQNRAIRLRPDFCLVPTTCGTGAEAADVVVYSRDDGVKVSVISAAFTARQVVLDGRFLDLIPAPKRAAFVSDALSHAVESFLSVVPNQLAKESALGALDLILRNYSPDPDSANKDRLMEASFLAGVAAANCSVGIVHAFAHAIGAAGMSHGLANACALEPGITFNSQTQQMTELLGRLGLKKAEDLIERVRAVTRCALENIDQNPFAMRLGSLDYQSMIADRMSQDITIRSNPRRPAPNDRLRFVADVVTHISNQ